MVLKALILVLGLCVPALAGAEDVPYANYRFEKALGMITITTGYLERTAVDLEWLDEPSLVRPGTENRALIRSI